MTTANFSAACLILSLIVIHSQDKTIHAAANDGDLARVQAILAQHPELVDAPDARGFTPLQLAVRGGHRDVVDALLASGADIDARHPQYGLAAVDFAFQRELQRSLFAGPDDSAGLTAYLVSRGAAFDPNAAIGGRTRLHQAAALTNAGLARLLVELGADVDAEFHEATALTFAASKGSAAIITLLLDNGADPNPIDEQGKTPILRAVEVGAAAAAEVLIARGADLDVVEPQTGEGLLHLAVLSGSADIVSALLDRGLPVDATDGKGKTPLYYAARYGHETVASVLLAHGAVKTPDMEEHYGMSPHLTRRMGRGEAAAWYLANRGWLIRTQRHALVFDAEEWGINRPTQPSLANGFITPGQIRHLNVVAIYTTYHGVVGEPGAYLHEIEDSLPNVTYVHDAGHGWRWPGNTVYVSPGEQTAVGDVEIRTIEVTPRPMVSLGYLVNVDGLTIYYAGFNPKDLGAYEGALESLEQQTDGIDMAFLPMAQPDEEESAFKVFVETFDPRSVFVLDPNRREHLYPEMARKVREWGFDATVHTAEHPGDVFLYHR